MKRGASFKINGVQICILLNEDSCTLNWVDLRRSVQGRPAIIRALSPDVAASPDKFLEKSWVVLQHNLMNHSVTLRSQFLLNFTQNLFICLLWHIWSNFWFIFIWFRIWRWNFLFIFIFIFDYFILFLFFCLFVSALFDLSVDRPSSFLASAALCANSTWSGGLPTSDSFITSARSCGYDIFIRFYELCSHWLVNIDHIQMIKIKIIHIDLGLIPLWGYHAAISTRQLATCRLRWAAWRILIFSFILKILINILPALFAHVCIFIFLFV